MNDVLKSLWPTMKKKATFRDARAMGGVGGVMDTEVARGTGGVRVPHGVRLKSWAPHGTWRKSARWPMMGSRGGERSDR
jgi:hypothetical protein